MSDFAVVVVRRVRKALAFLTPEGRFALARYFGVQDDTYGRSRTDMIDLLIEQIFKED